MKKYTDNEYSSHCSLIFQPIGYVVLAKTSVEEQHKINGEVYGLFTV